MNKKLLSLVLATAFTFSLGVGTSLARVDIGNAGDTLSTGGGSSSQIGFTINNSDLTRFAESTLGNLVTVFGYAAGTMTYAASKTGIQFYDANGMKAGYSVTENASSNPKTYSYTMTSLSISGSDIAAIQAAGGLKQFLINCGISEDALKSIKHDSSGNLLDGNGNQVGSEGEAALVDAGWLSDNSVSDWLAQGINFSATISLGGSDPQVTLSENGKASYTLGTDAWDAANNKAKSYIATEYIYTSTGALDRTVNAQLKAKSGENGTTYEMEFSVTKMDSFGRQSYTYLTDKNGTAINFNKTTYDAARQTYTQTSETASGHLTDFNYSANGSLVSYTDNTSGNTFHYVAGQMSHVTNKEGAIVTQYNYNNGIMRSVQSFNGGTIASTTVFDDFGRNLGTVQGGVSYDTAVTAIRNVLNGTTNLNTQTGASGCIVQSVQVYKDYIGVYNSFLNQNKNINFSSLASKTYGNTSAIASISISTGDTAASGAGAATSTTGEGQSRSLAGTYTINVGGTTKTITISSANDIAAMSKEDAEALCDAAGIDRSNIKQISTVSGTNVSDTSLYTINAGENIVKAMTTLGITNTTGTTTQKVGVGASLMGATYIETTTTSVSAATASLTTTCYVQGVATKQATTYLGQTTTVSTSRTGSKKDPVVTGTLLGTTVVDGRTYAMVGNADVNIMDGTGFKAAEGETIMVDITGNEAMINVAAGEKVMFMGDVAQSVNGHLAIAMNTNYGGGFIQGISAVEAAKIEITEKSQAVARARDGLELGTITQSEYEQIVKDAGWVGNNTAANLEMFAKGNFSWDENKTPIQNLRDAWNLLLSF